MAIVIRVLFLSTLVSALVAGVGSFLSGQINESPVLIALLGCTGAIVGGLAAATHEVATAIRHSRISESTITDLSQSGSAYSKQQNVLLGLGLTLSLVSLLFVIGLAVYQLRGDKPKMPIFRTVESPDGNVIVIREDIRANERDLKDSKPSG